MGKSKKVKNETVTPTFIVFTAFVDGHSIAARIDAVRVVEEEQVDEKKAARVTLTDGTQFVVRETVDTILVQMETISKNKNGEQK